MGEIRMVTTFSPSTGVPGGSAEMFPNAPAVGGWITKWNEEWTDLPVRHADPYYEGNTSDAYHLGVWPDHSSPWGNVGNPHDYVSLNTGFTIWSGEDLGAWYAMRIPKDWPGGWAPVKIGQNRYKYAEDGPFTWDKATAPTGDLYHGFWVRLRGTEGSQYTSSGNQQKFWYYKDTPDGGVAHIVLGADAPGNGAADLTYVTQFQGGAGVNDDWPGTSPDINDGGWHRVEVLLTANTHSGSSPNSDGTLKMWLDDVLIADHSNVLHYGTSQQNRVLNDLYIEPIYGGGSNYADIEVYMDVGRTLIMAR
jgi:hypothetical protein